LRSISGEIVRNQIDSNDLFFVVQVAYSPHGKITNLKLSEKSIPWRCGRLEVSTEIFMLSLEVSVPSGL
jgi:hypothetical protein